MTGLGELTYVSFPILKTETTPEGDLVVYGKATDGSVDSDEQIVDPGFAGKALQEWLDTGPNVRVQHNAQRDPAGVGIDMEPDKEGGHWVKALVVEPTAKLLVEKGALRAYSVGIARPTIVRDAVARGGRITGGQIVEISLVDRPANKNCGIQLVKATANGSPQYVGKVFGSSDLLTKGATVTLQLPADVSMSFTPRDMARIVAHKNGKDWDDDDDDDDDCDVGKAETAVLGKESRRFSAESRRRIASSGNALPDGSYPIPDEDGLRRAAILARSKHGNWKAARRLIARRARELRVPNPLSAKMSLGASPGPGGTDHGVGAGNYSGHPGMGATTNMNEDGTPVSVSMGKPRKGKKKKAVILQPAEKKQKVVCPKCGAMQNKDHVFCPECGSKVPSRALEVEKNHDFMCLKCGAELDKGEQFCPGCGKKNPGYLPEADQKIPANKMLFKGKKKKGFRVPANPGEGVTGIDTAPAPSDLGEFAGAAEETDMIQPHGPGEKAMNAAQRLKNAGAPRSLGVLHDMTCPAYRWADVVEVHPDASFAGIDMNFWQQKAMDAAAGAPMDEAGSLARLWQMARTLKESPEPALLAIRYELEKAFQDANPGPGSAPTPGSMNASRFSRPLISAGHESPSPGHEGPNTAKVPADGISASNYHRDYLTAGHAAESPSGNGGRPLETPHSPGVPQRNDYSMVKDGNARQAMIAMHDHLAHTFPDLCPMDSDPRPGSRAVPVAKGQSSRTSEGGGDSSNPGGYGGDDAPAFLKKPKKGKAGKGGARKAARASRRVQRLKADLASLKNDMAVAAPRGANVDKALAKELSRSRKKIDKRFQQQRKALARLTAAPQAPDPLKGAGAQLSAELRKTRREYSKLAAKQRRLAKATVTVTQPPPDASAPVREGMALASAAIRKGNAQLATEIRQSRRQLDRRFRAQQKMIATLTAQPMPDQATARKADAQVRAATKALAKDLRKTRRELDSRFEAQEARLAQVQQQPDIAAALKAAGADVRKAGEETVNEVRNALLQVLASPALTRGVPQSQLLPPLPQQTAKDTQKIIRKELASVTRAYKTAQRAQAKKTRQLAEQFDQLARQGDDSIHAFKGVALVPGAFKSANGKQHPVDAAAIAAANAERTQQVMLEELTKQFRTSPDPAEREAAWKAITKMRGITE
jgi:hypothetical protein